MSHACLYSLQNITTIWLVLIFHPAEDRRLNWPLWLVTYEGLPVGKPSWYVTIHSGQLGYSEWLPAKAGAYRCTRCSALALCPWSHTISLCLAEGYRKSTAVWAHVAPERLCFFTSNKIMHSYWAVSSQHLSFWTTVCKTVRPMLSVRCLSVLSVCLSCLWRWCIVAQRLDGSRWNLACR